RDEHTRSVRLARARCAAPSGARLMARGTPAVSAQQLDPLTWFTGRVVPIVFAGLVVLYGALRIPTWFVTELPWLQPVAIVLCAGACVFVYLMTRPLRPD